MGISSYFSDEINLTVNSDFEPKEVIDVEKALIAQDEEEERRTRLSKVMTYIIDRLIGLFLAIAMFMGVIVVLAHFVIST